MPKTQEQFFGAVQEVRSTENAGLAIVIVNAAVIYKMQSADAEIQCCRAKVHACTSQQGFCKLAIEL